MGFAVAFVRPNSTGAREPRSKAGDDGFALIEALVAIVILAVVLIAAEWGVATALSASSSAKYHDIASGLVSSTMASALALPFPELQAGLNPSVDDLSNDPNITAVISGGVTSYVLNLTGATIATSGTSASESPLVPHMTSVTDGVTFHVATYPTISSASPGLVTVVVVVSWSSGGESNQVVGEQGVASP